jgi:AcrR family transcriptional regulator
MAGPVNPRRSYDSPRRREQAAATKRQILEAAQRLFAAHGYPATTIAQIAREAGVSAKTVHLGFETKSGLLRALWHLQLRGDQDDVPVAGRAWYQEVLDEPDPARKLALNARNSRAVKVRAAALIGVLPAAAAADPEIAPLWTRIQQEFWENQRVVVASLHDLGALRDGLDIDEATDILWTLNHPTTWQLLVGERGWTPERYEAWLAEVSRQQLLA